MQTQDETAVADSRRRRPSRTTVRRAAVSACIVAMAFLVRWSLTPSIGSIQPFAMFYIAVAIIAWWEGWKSATAAAVLGLFLGWFFFLKQHSFQITHFSDVVQIVTYCAVCTALLLLMNRTQRAERKATVLVDERTIELEATNERLRNEIAKHKKTEAGLRGSEERFRLLVDAIRDYAIFRLDLKGNVLTWNPGAERLYGYSSTEVIGQHFSRFYTAEDRQSDKPAYELAVAADQGRYWEEGWRVRKDGSRFWANVTVAAVRDASGAVVGMAKITRDVTERMEMEKQLRETIAELEHYSYSITHDMRAPLRAMSAFSEMLMEKASGGPPETQEYCRKIQTGARRLDKLIQDALSYTRAVLQELPMESVDLAKLIHGIIETYPDLRADKADIAIEGPLPLVLGNESLLTQCFSNLLGNAVKFVAPGIRPSVRIWTELTDHFARISIRDNGIGIPEHAQKRLFGMFQKLDTEYEGTGIGLAIVRKVVERMGGKMGVESEVGKGSCFWIELPLAPDRSPHEN